MIRDWADTLRRGDVEGASEYFAVPATVSNGTPPLRLKSREDVEFFNRTLPMRTGNGLPAGACAVAGTGRAGAVVGGPQL